MIGDLRNLNKVHEIQTILIGMTHGKNSVATKSSLVQLNSKITLYDMLYVSGLKCNLISIAQFIDKLFCTITFTHKLCVIYYHFMRMPFG